MQRYDIKGPINDDTLNKTNSNFKMLFDEYSGAGLNATEARQKALEALSKSEQAVITANTAKDESESTQKQLDDIIIDSGTSDAETIQARGEFPVLNDRLNSVNEQLAEKAPIYSSGFIEYGLLSLPSDFPHSLPFDIWRNNEGSLGHGFEIQKYYQGAGSVYVDYTVSVDTNDGLTANTPKRFLNSAMTVAEGLPQSTVVIYIKNKYFVRNYIGFPQGTSYTLKKNIIFSPYQMDRTFIGNFENPGGLSWSADGAAYKCSRTTVNNVLDLEFLAYRGEPKKYKQVNSVTEVQAEQGTWYTDGTNLWIRRIDDKTPNDNVMVMLNISSPWFIINDKKLVFDRTSYFWRRTASDADGLRIEGNAQSELVLYKSSFAHATANGLATKTVGKVYNVESIAYGNKYDGFNYHGTIPMVTNPYEFVYEYYVEAWGNGLNEVGNNNGSTAHEGMSTLRLGTVCYQNDGPQIVDVNGCYSILYDCIGHTSTKVTDSPVKAGLYFNNSSSVKNGKVILINCGGGGIGTYSLNSDKLIEINLRNFKGNNVPADLQINLMS